MRQSRPDLHLINLPLCSQRSRVIRFNNALPVIEPAPQHFSFLALNCQPVRQEPLSIQGQSQLLVLQLFSINHVALTLETVLDLLTIPSGHPAHTGQDRLVIVPQKTEQLDDIHVIQSGQPVPQAAA